MSENKKELKVGISGYIALFVAVLFFSGVFGKMEGPLKVLDLQTLAGQFGIIADGASPGIMGQGGHGVRGGFFQSLTIAPNVFLSIAFITVIEHYGGLLAAQKLLTPLSRPVIGLPGSATLAMVSNWQSSDTGAAVARSLLDQEIITEKERDILLAYEFAGAAIIGMLYSNGVLLFPYLTVSPGTILLLVMILKFVAGNLMRLYINIFEKESKDLSKATS
jgi:nucleoside recognition membrane protein YjiH